MKNQLSLPAVAGILIVAVAVIGLILYKTTFGAPPAATKTSMGVGGSGMNVSPEQLKKAIQEEDAKKKP